MYSLHIYWVIWVKFRAEGLYIMPQCNCDCCENRQNDIHHYWRAYMKFTCIFYILAQIWYSESHASLSDINAYICTFHIFWLIWEKCGLINQHTMLLNICEFHENQCRQGCTYKYKLTLRLLISYIYGAPSKARNANVVYIWTYVWQHWNSLFLFAAQCFNTESMQRGFLWHFAS